MSVQITINGDNATEAIQEFATLSAAFTGQAPAPVVVEESKPRQTRKVVEQPKTEAKDLVEDKPETKTDQQPAGDSDDIPTVVDLRAMGQEKGKTAEGKKSIKALLDKFESKSLSDVPEEKRVAFMVELEAI